MKIHFRNDLTYSQATFIALPNQADELQESVNNAMEHLGPVLAEALIFNIGGHAARSELDKLSDPLKKLILRQGRSKQWLEAALFGKNFPSDKVTDKEKTVFIQKIVRYYQLHPLPEPFLTIYVVFAALDQRIWWSGNFGWLVVGLILHMPRESR
jgi:hypothetical protein